MSIKYSLCVTNNAALAGNMCVYQTFDEQQTIKNLFSLAWFCRGCNPSTKVRFTWGTDYAFFWSESGELVPGVTVDASQDAPADNNAITLTHADGRFLFTNATQAVPSGTLGLFADQTVPSNTAAVGISMSGSPILAMQASPNFQFLFKPNPRYWVCFGNYDQGTVLDANEITNAQEIKYGTNRYSIHMTLQENNTFVMDDPVV